MDRVLLSLTHKKNSEIIADFLGKEYEIKLLDENTINEDFSLLITDLVSWNFWKDRLIKLKTDQNPIFLPYLVVVPQKDLKTASRYIWTTFDEVVSVPISQAVLLARVHLLINNRNLSVKVNNLLNDKEMLMKEIHHRVKNNLMIISSLLSLQSGYIEDPKTKELFRESQNRARSMAQIHERLYQSSDLKKIEMGDYIRTMAKDLFHTYATDQHRVELKLDVEESLVDVNAAIPLGLILNEIITNSLKYAFPEPRSGCISIGFHQEDKHFLLEIRDDGVGLPEDLEVEKSDSLGMQLISSLSIQLGAEVEVLRDDGTCYMISFQEDDFK
jgi:two-component sensor histidine kinase